MLNKNLDKNISVLDETFKNCGDIVARKLPFAQTQNIFFYIIYIDMLTDRELIETQIINRLMHKIYLSTKQLKNIPQYIFDEFKNYGMTTAEVKQTDNFDEINTEIMSGNTVLLIDGFAKALIVSTKSFPSRGIQSTEIESVVYGPKDSFTEGMRHNTALIRRRIRDTNLKVKQMKIGQRSKTDIAIMYLKDVAREKIINEVEKKLEQIDIDAVLDIGYIQQFLDESWKSVFPQSQITERPDKTSSAILEGRIAIISDNSPFSLIIPATLPTFFQSSEDYYERWQIMNFLRIMRYIAAIISISLPGLFIALSLFHPSMIPMKLVLKLADERQAVPFSTVFEIIIMELAFELLKEAGIRLPNPIGSTIGIVGGIIIGQAAVDAGLVSPIIIIIIALTAISSFSIPNANFVSALRLLKYIVIFFSAMFGLFGFWTAILTILIHLASLKSFGIPYLYPIVSGEVNNFNDLEDTFFRFPIFKMKKRPIFANKSQNIRQGENKNVFHQ